MSRLVLVVYVPEAQKEQLKNALFEAGAGRIGNYDSCSWEVQGRGQFRPLQGSKPFLGAKDQVEQVSEFRIEMILEKSRKSQVEEALLKAHPYETPAYHYLEVLP